MDDGGKINLRPLSKEPLWLSQEAYRALVRRQQGGWSRCDDQTEWLAKLHYLRKGWETQKLSREDFDQREERLVLTYLQRLL